MTQLPRTFDQFSIRFGVFEVLFDVAMKYVRHLDSMRQFRHQNSKSVIMLVEVVFLSVA